MPQGAFSRPEYALWEMCDLRTDEGWAPWRRKAGRALMVTLKDRNTSAFPEHLWVGRNVAHLRDVLQLTQAEFGRLCGVTTSLISALEGQKTNPTLEVLAAISRGAGITVAQLVSEDRRTWPADRR
jgi:DNA-binding XRE family transcriptional regulator